MNDVAENKHLVQEAKAQVSLGGVVLQSEVITLGMGWLCEVWGDYGRGIAEHERRG